MEKEKCINARKTCSFISFCRRYSFPILNVILSPQICITLLPWDNLPVYRTILLLLITVFSLHTLLPYSAKHFQYGCTISCIHVKFTHCIVPVYWCLTNFVYHTYCQFGTGIHTTNCFTIALKELLICISMQELTV